MDYGPATPYCATPYEPGSWESIAQSVYCGASQLASVPFGAVQAVVTNGQNTVGNVVTNGQNTVGGVITNGQNVVGNVGESAFNALDDAANAANPLNLAGLGFGAVLAVVGVGVVGGFAADWLLAEGSGTRALVAFVSNKRRGRR